MQPEVEKLVERVAAKGHHALVAGVSRAEERTVHGWSRDGTSPGERTLFEIGSITKAVTGVLLAEMQGRGEVALDDPLSRHLAAAEHPQWRNREPTLEEIATHRASLPNTPRGLGRRELAYVLGLRRTDPWIDLDAASYRAAVNATRSGRVPARRMGYSSLGFGLLGEALARRAGMSYEALLCERILDPLGMHDTAIDVPAEARERLLEGHSRRGHPRPPLEDLMPAAGSLRSGAADMLTLLEASLTPPPGPLGAALELARTPRHERGRISIGLGWVVLTRKGKPPVAWHNGGTWGFRGIAALVPGEGVAAVALANTARGVDRLGFDLVDAALAA